MPQAKYITRNNTPNLWQRLSPRKFPKLLSVVLILVGITIVSIVVNTIITPSTEKSPSNLNETPITLNFIGDEVTASPETENTTGALTPEATDAPEVNTQVTTEAPVQEKLNTDDLIIWNHQTIKSGDNLSTLFQRVSLNAKDVHALMTSTPLAKPLVDIRPGQEIQFGFNRQGDFVQLKYVKTKLESYLYKQIKNNDSSNSMPKYTGEHIILEPEIMTAYREAVIKDSLFLSAERAQLPHGLIMELANIFGWDVDFALDIRKGDRFSLTYEEKFLHGEKIGNGNILTAEFVNQGKSFKAVRYEDSKGRSNYYTPEGYSMRKAFLRAPLDFTRISSNFNLRRKHPIHKKIRAHRGVDYVAPRGTPIFAAGDGKVIASSYSRANGNYVFIQHGQRFTTKYLHLQKRKVKRGQTVKQRQVIGTLGSTGYSTGPHLHYEFLVNGVHRNPRTVALPQAEPVGKKELARFTEHTKPLIAQLQQYQGASQLAFTTADESDKPATPTKSSN